MKMSLSELARITDGELLGSNATFDGMCVDSRSILSGELFCAVRGERQDGHRFVESALESGAVGALVESDPSDGIKKEHFADDFEKHFYKMREQANRPVVVVQSVLSAMAAAAMHFRRALTGPVIGVTGSAGKTTVKEMVYAALSPLGEVLKSDGNLNTEYGVPITWSRLRKGHCAAVIEMAMRGPRQIAHLARISSPDIGIVTSLGSAHVGELGSLDAIARAKAELVEALPMRGVAIVPAESERKHILREAANCRVMEVGPGGDVEVVESRQEGDSVAFAIAGPAYEVVGRVPGFGKTQALNAAFAVAAAAEAGVDPQIAADALQSATFPENRMKAIEREGVTVLLDAYNSSPESCKIALGVLAEYPARRRIAMLGDMLELGEFTEEKHREIGAAAHKAGVDRLVLVGEFAPIIGEGAREAGFVGEIEAYPDAAAAAAAFQRLEPGDVVLVKASRGVGLEAALC